MKRIRFCTVGMGVQGSLYSANAIVLSGWKNVPLKVPWDGAVYDAELQKRIAAEG